MTLFETLWRHPHRRHVVALASTGVLALVIAVLTLTPATAVPSMPIGDKLAHFVAFAGLALPNAVLYARIQKWTFPAIIAFGGLIEILQPYVGRDRDLFDFLAGSAGATVVAVIGFAVVWVLREGRELQEAKDPAILARRGKR